MSLQSLCPLSENFFGAVVIVLLSLTLALFLADFILSRKNPKAGEKLLLRKGWKATLVLAFLGIIVFFLTPPISSYLATDGKQIDFSCGYNFVPTPPYCGQEYCNHITSQTDFSNCTCLQY